MLDDIIVFGRGAYYQRKCDELKKRCRIVAFLDNNTEGEKFFDGTLVHRPDELAFLPKVSIYVMVSYKYIFDVIKQLRQLGISPERIVLGPNIAPAFDDFEELILQNKASLKVNTDGITLSYGGEVYTFDNIADYQRYMNRLRKTSNNYIDFFSNMPIKPANIRYGYPFGKPIDRYYIEKFLQENKQYISGNVMEIADNRYTYQFGHDISNAYALHVFGERNAIKGDLSTGEGIKDNFVDCLICTQTLQYIFNLHSATKNIYRLLKPGGTVLVTVPCISQIDVIGNSRWGECWRFTEKSLREMLETAFSADNIKICKYGNVKTAICFLYGMIQDDLTRDDFEYNDERYPIVIAAIARKL